MPFKSVVFESVSSGNKNALKTYIKKSVPVYIIEPFVAYHLRKGVFHGFPKAFPEHVERLLQKGIVKLLPAESIDAKTIYRQAADKAVDVIESVYPEYRKAHMELFEYICHVLKSPVAENSFKKNLCDKLAGFYSINILLHRVGKLLGPEPILVYPDANVRSYLYLRDLLSGSRQDFLKHPNIHFPQQAHVVAFFENLKEYLIAMTRLSAQTIISALLRGRCHIHKGKKSYSYSVSVVWPMRQLTDNQRGPDFIIDNDKIHPEDIIYIPLCELTTKQKIQLEKLPCSVYYLPKAGRYFSHSSQWRRLFWLTLRRNLLHNAQEINIACNVFFNYFLWLKVLENITLKHFITHCDFGISHIGRNIALSQAGVQTWYFTDSMNHGCNWKREKGEKGMRHPLWTYLSYDHLVTWNGLLSEYCKEHPGSFKQTHVVGCLWGGHIKREDKTGNQIAGLTLKNLKDKFILTAFDTTYSNNGFCSYREGLVFAEHLMELADAIPDVHIFLKEKKIRHFHCIYDPVLGPRLIELYKKMDSHPRITTYSEREDASELISISDMVVSFPFTSTTFEALSVNKPAIWHDPLGYYRDTLYGRIKGVITHGFEELKLKVLEIKNMELGTYQNPIQTDSPLMDPYRDGKAIDRFRELLCSPENNRKQT